MDNSPVVPIKIKEGFVGQQMVVLSPDKMKMAKENMLFGYLYPTAVGYYPRASHHDRERPNGSEQYILLYCVGGQGWIEMDGNEIELHANTFYIIPKGLPHHYGSSEKEPWSIYWIHFSGEQAAQFYRRFEVNAGKEAIYIAYKEAWLEEFYSLMASLEDEISSEAAEFIYIKTVKLLSDLIYHDKSQQLAEDDAISASVSYMKKHLKENIQVQELAAQQNLSVSHFSSLFRKKTGFSPIQFFINLKLQKACQFLYFTPLSMKEICQEVGFDDPFYFSRIFKKQMGQAPSDYRKQYKG
ncbi:AraC family transcriptional regulator [Pontibacter qinzhouensis]|uniref:AraC family transcriptional regulator n=1 Tax=Pontibacter qinzhouensis TaxID=2603253 RepID=A0A5C8K679_9BACT|nr:AraC family transcriptional regulator [Pontibacter qinzhouensis]TXK44314.1 AraC family transcriptional regulator [Pontibacter qinzhouensis]